MPLVHEGAADRARAGIQILVAAPYREIRAALVQLERQIADPVREIEAHDAPRRVRSARDPREVEGLPGAKLYAGPQHQRDVLPVTLEELLDLRFADEILPWDRGELDQIALHIAAV